MKTKLGILGGLILVLCIAVWAQQPVINNALTDVWDSTNHWLKVNIQNSSIAVTGTFWQATQPVSNAGTFATQATLQAGTATAGGFMPTPTTASTQAVSAFEGDAVTTASTVKASAGNFYGYLVTNTNASVCYLQVFNTTTPTLGTTAPIISMGIPASGAANVQFPFPVNFSTAIAVASTTASKGASTCGTGMTITAFYE